MIPRKYLYHEEWNTAIQKKHKKIDTPDDINVHLQSHPVTILKKKYHFQADPFLVEYADKLYVFYEAWNHTWTRGRIRCRVLDKNLAELEDFEVKGVNSLKCHLSFPNVFMYEGEYYMIPETYQADKTYIFQATEFPKQWKLINTLAEGISLVDSALIIKDDDSVKANLDNEYKFYLVSGRHKDNELVIHVANHLTDDWVRYEGDIHIADHHNRLAGGVIKFNNQTYLPFQERHPKEYGKSVFIKPIDIDENNWQEQVGVQINSFSDKYPTGLHTLNITENYIVVDVKREAYQPFNFFVRKYRQLATPIKKFLLK